MVSGDKMASKEGSWCPRCNDRFPGQLPAFCPQTQCYECGGYGHEKASCPVVVCLRCHQAGHIARDCPLTQPTTTAPNPTHSVATTRPPRSRTPAVCHSPGVTPLLSLNVTPPQPWPIPLHHPTPPRPVSPLPSPYPECPPSPIVRPLPLSPGGRPPPLVQVPLYRPVERDPNPVAQPE